MLDEEKELMKWADEDNDIHPREGRKLFYKEITALVKAVREDAAKTVETMCKEENDNVACIVCRDQAAAIRRK